MDDEGFVIFLCDFNMLLKKNFLKIKVCFRNLIQAGFSNCNAGFIFRPISDDFNFVVIIFDINIPGMKPSTK